MRSKGIAAKIVVPAVLIASAAIALALVFGTQATTNATEAPTRGAQGTSPAQPVIYLEGWLEEGVECGCQFLQTVEEKYELWADLTGFTCGERVAVWGTVCTSCVSICMEGAIILVQDIVALPPTPTATPTPVALDDPVGGVAQLPDVASDSDSSTGAYTALAGGLAAVALALSASAWYVRRRWAR